MSNPSEQAIAAAKEVIKHLEPYDLKWGVDDLTQEVAAIIDKHVKQGHDIPDILDTRLGGGHGLPFPLHED
jgi:hypothetical protein